MTDYTNGLIFLIYFFIMAVLSSSNIGYFEPYKKAWIYNLCITIISLVGTIVVVTLMLAYRTERSQAIRTDYQRDSILNKMGINSAVITSTDSTKTFKSINKVFGGDFFQLSGAFIFIVSNITLSSLIIDELRRQGVFGQLTTFSKVTLISQLSLSVVGSIFLFGVGYNLAKIVPLQSPAQIQEAI